MFAALAGTAASSGVSRAQTATPAPVATASPANPATTASPPGSQLPPSSPSPTPTQPPIVLQPAGALVAVGTTQTVRVMSAIAPLRIAVSAPAVLSAAIDENAEVLTLTGNMPGTTQVVVTDARGVSATLPVRVAYAAGSITPTASVRITGNPATPDFVKAEAVAVARSLAVVRPGAQLIATPGEVTFSQSLPQDDVAAIDVPILIQGEQYFSVSGTTRVTVENVAAPAIVPDSLLVSDYPERLTANGVLFADDVKRTVPSRFLYFHFNPPGQQPRRIVLRAENAAPEPAILQFISGDGGPDPNEMLAGHDATKTFLERQVQNEGRILVVPARGTLTLAQQDMPPNAVVSGMLQLRVLSGSTVHLTLFAENASSSIDEPLSSSELLSGGQLHARGVFRIPEFHSSAVWNTNESYLELSIGDIPLPNLMNGQALAGDYGVKQSFVVKVQNPSAAPQAVAIYENPRGGRATGTYLIDGVLIQSHQVPPFSRYKIRQYVVPARGFVRVSIVTIPDSGSSYPLRLIFAPDDGSVAPGAPGSPVY